MRGSFLFKSRIEDLPPDSRRIISAARLRIIWLAVTVIALIPMFVMSGQWWWMAAFVLAVLLAHDTLTLRLKVHLLEAELAAATGGTWWPPFEVPAWVRAAVMVPIGVLFIHSSESGGGLDLMLGV